MVLSRTVFIIVVLGATPAALGAEAVAKAALGAEALAPQPVRPNAPLPIPAAALAAALDLPGAARSRLMLDAIRLLFNAPETMQDESARRRARLANALRAPHTGERDVVPLPLGATVWREVLLDKTAAVATDDDVVRAILANRPAALLYYGFAAMDDETLEWFSSHRDLLTDIRKTPGAVAVFGRSVRIRQGRIVVPGGESAERIWQEVVGEAPADPRRFVRALFGSREGRLAFFYDAVAHLDPPRQRFALGGADGKSATTARDVAAIFKRFARDWEVEERPFARPQLDPWIVMHAVTVDADGRAPAPGIAVMEQVFRDDAGLDVPFKEVPANRVRPPRGDVDAAWLTSHVNTVPYPDGRRRLDVFLFGQRIFGDRGEPDMVANVLRAYLSMPALLLTLERTGIRDGAVLLTAARYANALHSIGDDEGRRSAVSLFQVLVSLIERGARSRAVSTAEAQALITSLCAVPADRGRGYEERIALWTRGTLFKAAPEPPLDAGEPVEAAVIALLSGARPGRTPPTVDWEGRRYWIDPAEGERRRLLRVRERQGGLSIDAAIAGLLDRGGANRKPGVARRDFVNTMVSVLYAVHLGDPEGPALAGDNVALRHRLESPAPRPGVRSLLAWRLPFEVFGSGGWHVEGSLLSLDVALRRLVLRRLDDGLLPEGPSLPTLDRQVATLAPALMNPHTLTDAGRDRIAAALRRGRERFAALRTDASQVDAFAADGGVSEWRRESLRWALANQPDTVDEHVSLLDLLHAGLAAQERNDDLAEWGATMLPLTGCLCLGMPPASAWENLAGRPAAGALGTRSVDVSLRIAETLAKLKLPASLAPGILAFAMQDVTDAANPAYFDEWQAFARAARSLPEDRILDYISALTADGPLVPAGGGR